MKILGIIPSRYASTRFPGKPLTIIDGKSMVQRVYEQASRAKGLLDVIVATDDQRIFDHISEFGGNVLMTSSDHLNGTERCAEVVQKHDESIDAVINIQGDEPFINPQQITDLAGVISLPEVEIGTQVKKINSNDELFSNSVMKVVFDKDLNALYFSRNTIPFLRGIEKEKWLQNHTFYKHIGLYAYKTNILNEIVKLSPGLLETAESLEQLRWLENGYKIKVQETEFESISIDTPDDLKTL